MPKALSLVSDSYERKARLYPALVLLGCPVACFVVINALSVPALQSLATTLAGCGGAFLLVQISRNAGRSAEPALYKLWGGMPSTAILRHRDERIDPVTKARYHQQLAELADSPHPTPEEETQNPAAADHVYAAWSTYLRLIARNDQKKYPLVHQENTGFGYWRNLWGLRSWGIGASALSAVAVLTQGYLQYQRTGAILVGTSVAGLLALGFLVFWIFRVSPTWVRIPADAYAARLIEIVDSVFLEKTNSRSQRKTNIKGPSRP